MPQIEEVTLGTDKQKSPVNWHIHHTGVVITKELFDASHVRTCIDLSEKTLHKSKNIHLKGIADWAKKSREEKFHSINAQAFISIWAAQEAGIENIFSTLIQTEPLIANYFCTSYPTKFNISNWPWPEDTCLEIAKKSDQWAKEKIKKSGNTKNAGKQSARIIEIFSWFNIEIIATKETLEIYDEASTVRNNILHRYGELTEKERTEHPRLQATKNKKILITDKLLREYFQSTADLLISISNAISNCEQLNCSNLKKA